MDQANLCYWRFNLSERNLVINVHVVFCIYFNLITFKTCIAYLEKHMQVSFIFLHTIFFWGGVSCAHKNVRYKQFSQKKNSGNNIDNNVLSMCSWLRKQCKYRIFTYIEESSKQLWWHFVCHPHYCKWFTYSTSSLKPIWIDILN